MASFFERFRFRTSTLGKEGIAHAHLAHAVERPEDSPKQTENPLPRLRAHHSRTRVIQNGPSTLRAASIRKRHLSPQRVQHSNVSYSLEHSSIPFEKRMHRVHTKLQPEPSQASSSRSAQNFSRLQNLCTPRFHSPLSFKNYIRSRQL